MNKANGVMRIDEIIHPDPPRLLVLYDRGQEYIVQVFADVIGQEYVLLQNGDAIDQKRNEGVVALESTLALRPDVFRATGRTVITTHAIDIENTSNEALTSFCDYEYLYTHGNLVQRDVARFLGFVLGQIKPHEDLKKKARTTLLSTTFPDIRAALPNLDILSVGADSVELRVDLLQEPLEDGVYRDVPSLKYVGEQVMLLRQRTELPIIFTIRCRRENGRFPMGDPKLCERYLMYAKKWGVEYIDVEIWLPEEIRQGLAREKANSKVISAWHDFSGDFKWTSAEAQQLFKKAAEYGDVVKMIAIVKTMEENYELEYFRSTIQSTYPQPPFSGLNMESVGQLSRTTNKVFTPITHPLLPLIAAPGQLSAAEINSMLHSMGQLPKLDMYVIGNVRASGPAMFLEKCLNELSLPHVLRCIEHVPQSNLELLTSQLNFGGAYMNPPFSTAMAGFPKLTEAAKAIGQVDTIVVQSAGGGKSLIGDNASWKGIRAMLTRDFVPSAYSGRPALILANSDTHAAAAIYALTSLDIGSIYTIGFKTKGLLASGVQQFRGVEDLKKLDEPFVIISALPADKSLAVSPLLRHYSNARRSPQRCGRVFVDLSNGIRGRGDSVAIAADLGFNSYGVAEVNSWITVETLRLLVGQNVGFDFVRLASGRSLYV